MTPFAKRQRGAVTLLGALFIIVVIVVMVQLVNQMASSGISDSTVQNDAVDALFVAESGIEYASFLYANGATCADLALIPSTPAGRGSFDVTTAGLVGTDCRIVVSGSVSSVGASAPDAALRTLAADLRLASGEGWAVGDAGTMLHWDGVAWSAVASNTTADLQSVHCVNANNCWAVGNGGTIIRWDGNNWSQDNIAASVDLKDVSCQPSTSTHCYANGAWMFFGVPLVAYSARWNGSSWTNAGGTGLFDGYTGVSCPAATCFSVTAGGSVQRSSPWTVVFNDTVALNGIDCPAADRCWVVGNANGGDHHFVGYNYGAAGWSARNVPPAKKNELFDLNTVSCATVDDCWAAGDRVNSLYGLAHWDGANWTPVTSFSSGTHRENLNGIHCATASDCWAVGNQRNGWNLIHYDGTAWSYVGSAAPNPQNLNDVYLPSAGAAGVSLVRWQEVINN